MALRPEFSDQRAQREAVHSSGAQQTGTPWRLEPSSRVVPKQDPPIRLGALRVLAVNADHPRCRSRGAASRRVPRLKLNLDSPTGLG